ncbi:MAG: DUF480 domain-containing protein [Actinobacteria bacterium]|jgi:uncharacterized protein YceH (UPF0502 family)|uniref:Unannotated protein n=1 Tax=freshwater metagenome TaxID=449393 RepID=A0A6J6TEQ4_9ZZZZ|nr:DUF480 domain-containing protein [Actinomycetota bacterium]MSW76060.1 DUF480 domain-containing protein [Actinomycetota bacterium]MSX54782.1 DUF480 domain-containing protein [Actinomycetota bacterium]MSX93886.1 DUF480 domain-containing protein [Actinomycetota bacterium]MSZ84636.1 DUF480 domain-containing protein [Actinomycetota bacterium]
MLTVIEARVLGCLLEKERTVPDQYPLTLNTLVLACNQTTSREPVMHLADHEVEAVLLGLKSQTLVRYVHPAHGRSVTRYRQVADEAWGIDAPSAALLAVLLLRGPQTSAELATRTERMHVFASPAQMETTLAELVSAGMVQALGRQPGQREHRWQQLLAEEVVAAGHEDGSVPAPPPVMRTTGVTVTDSDRIADLERRMVRLETELAGLLTGTDAPESSMPE